MAIEERAAGGARRIVDADGLFVLPGLIDPDVNFRDPGLEYKETWETGAASAVCGGVTSVLVMPNAGQPVMDSSSFDAQLKRATGRSLVNFGFKAAVTPSNRGGLRALAERGVVGFRFSMAGKNGAIDPLSDLEILESFREIESTGLPCGVHTENRDITAGLTQRAVAAGTRVIDLNDVRPALAEVEAIQRVLALAEQTRVRIVLYHVSTAAGLREALRHRIELGDRLRLETNTHYALMSAEEMVPTRGPALAMFPPIRAAADQREILGALADGRIDVLGSDHSPHSPSEKNYDDPAKSAAETTPGWPGVETSCSVMLSAVNDGAMTLERFVEVQSANPAKIWGLYPRKGRVSVGADADLTLVSMDSPGRVDESRLKTLHKRTNWNEWRTTASAVMTIVAGEIVAADGEIASEAFPGSFLRPLPSD